MSQNAGSKKRRREAYNIDVKLVEIYEDLANEKEDIRLKAAHKLVSRFTLEANPTADEVQKALQRLFRGLSSGRKAARIGFSIALTEVLSQVFSPNKSEELAELSVTKVIDVWESSTKVGGGERGQENRDHHFGRLFGAEAIIKSSILFQDSEFEQWSRVLNLIFDLGKKKPWLREECGWILYRAIYELASQKIHAKYAESIVEGVCSNELAKTPEGVAVWLSVKDLFPTATLPSNVWKYNDPLDRHDRKTLSKVMKESSAADETTETEGLAKNSSGVWNSKLHFAWDAVLARLYESETTDKKSKGPRLDFSDFWVEVVDNGLFAAASSDERKYWGFLVFMKILNEAPSQLAGQIFTKNLVRCLMNQMADKERYLNRMAVKAAKTIQTRVTKEPEFAAAAAGGLMGPSGSVNFDQLTKSNTVEKIVVEAGPTALKSIIDLLAGFITVPGTEETNAAASIRNYISRLFVSTVKPRSSTGGEFQPLLEEILFVLVRFAYFADETAKPPVSQASQELFRNKINLCLNSLVSSNKDPAGVAYAVVRQVRNLQKTNEHGKFIIDMDETISESVDAAFKSLKKLSSKVKHDEDKKDPSVQAFRLLYSLTILEVYNGDADAVSMLDELAFCYTKFWGDKKSKKEDKSDASNALVEILLSFASKPSQLFRRMSEQVFGVFAEQITADGLQSLISVLEVKENLAGQQEMFDKQDDEDEEMPDADEDSDDDSDADSVEVIDADKAENDESEEDEEEDEGEDEEELAVFDAKLAEALGTNGDNQDVDSDADMNDDEMEAVDEMLVKVFKERRKAITKKKDKKDAKETMTNFKNRVLDLLQVYIKKCYSSMLALDLILPLLQLTRRSTVDQISQKAGNLLAEYTSLCKRNAIPTLSKSEDDEEHDPVEAVWELLRSVHKEATIQHRQKHSASVSQASLLLVRVLVAQDRQNIAQVIDIYAETQKTQMLNKNSHFKSGFFADWNAWCVNFGKNSKR